MWRLGMLFLSLLAQAQVLCKRVLPENTSVTMEHFTTSSMDVCMPLVLTPDAITVVDLEGTTLTLTKNTLAIQPVSGKQKIQKRQDLGYYALWLEASEVALRSGKIRKGVCHTRNAIRKCSLVMGEFMRYTLIQHTTIPHRWITHLVTTDTDTMTLWYVLDKK